MTWSRYGVVYYGIWYGIGYPMVWYFLLYWYVFCGMGFVVWYSGFVCINVVSWYV